MSKAIDDLRHEHEAIISALRILDEMVGRLGGANPPSADDLRAFLAFLREFADRCHHGKEEGILFPALIAAGIPEEGGAVGVMRAEHREGRKLIKDMDAALGSTVDTRAYAAAASAYTALLRSHIEKENSVLFPAAEQALGQQQLDAIYGRFEEHEEKVIGHGRHEELHALLRSLKQKYQVS